MFVFKAASTLITASNSMVAVIGVNPCNVYWQVGSSATLGTNSHFQPPHLACTGNDNAKLIWGALAALVLGSMLVLLGRRRGLRARHRR